MTTHKRSEKTLVIIPCLNEQGAIARVVTDIRTLLPDTDVLVIDDGSCDNTSMVAQAAGALVVIHPFNLGIGGAVQTGLKFAKQAGYDNVVRMDGDGQHNASEVNLMLEVAPMPLLQLLQLSQM